MIEKIGIFDIDSIAFAIGSGNKVLDSNNIPIKVDNKFVYTDKTEQELMDSADYWMNEILTKGGFTGYIGWIKGNSTTTSRLKVNPTYKGNRPKESPKWWDFVKKDLMTRWHIYEAHDYEVDDYVNSCRFYLKNAHIVAIDGDLLGLESLHPHYNWRKDEWITVTRKQAEIKFWTDMIAGQTGDNIKGLEKKGVKYAEKLFRDCYNEYPENQCRDLVLNEYVNHYDSEWEGITEFYKTYNSLKIRDDLKLNYIPVIPVQHAVESKTIEI